MISRCSHDSQYGRSGRHVANVSCSLFNYRNNYVRYHNGQRPKGKTWTWVDNHLVLHSYFRSNLSKRGYRKRMIEIWKECANFHTSQRLTNQVRIIIIKKGWFSDLEMLVIHQKTSKQHDNTVPDKSSVFKKKKKKQPSRNELLTLENENAKLPNNKQPSNLKETLSLQLCRGVILSPTSVLDMTLNNLMMRFQ